MRLALLGVGGNSLGRLYCLWLIARHLGWDPQPVLCSGQPWPSLDGTLFGQALTDLKGETRRLDELASDVIIAYQPLPETLGTAVEYQSIRTIPIIVDIDEPAWEAYYGYTTLGRLRVNIGMVRRRRNPLIHHRLRRVAAQLPKLLSNPSLADLYTGIVVPHVREVTPNSPMASVPPLRVAFVGTVRPHKGVGRLRAAVGDVGGTELTITAPAPKDACPDEHWVGFTSLESGRQIIADSHVCGVLSDDSEWARRQFPAKIVDAMMAGRVVIGSDLPPIRWALGNTGVLVPPGDRHAVARTLSRLRDDPDHLHELGLAALARAREMFTPAAAAPAFRAAVNAAIDSSDSTMA